MTTTKPIPLDEGLLFETLESSVPHAAARNHLQNYLTSGGGPNRKAKGRTLLEISAANGWVEETENLLARGADVHTDNDVALRRSACEGHADRVRLLLDHSAVVHAADSWALRRAATNGHADRVRLLLANGADIHALNDGALRQAAINHHKPTTEVLLMAGASAVVATEHATRRVKKEVLATIDACAAAIPADQRQGLLKSFGKQMPVLSALVRQEQRRSSRNVP